MIALFIYWKQRQKKSLSYTIVSDAPLLSVDEEIADHVEIKYHKTPVKNLRVIIIKIWNSGNQPIRSSDYEEMIHFPFLNTDSKPRPVGLVSPSVIATEPENLPVVLAMDGKRMGISQELLNPGDSVTMKIVMADVEKELKVTVAGRIVGVKEITLEKPQFTTKYSTKDMLKVGGGMIAFGLILLQMIAIKNKLTNPLDALLFLVNQMAALIPLVALVVPLYIVVSTLNKKK